METNSMETPLAAAPEIHADSEAAEANPHAITANPAAMKPAEGTKPAKVIKRRSSTVKFLEEVRTSTDWVMDASTRSKSRATRNSRGEGTLSELSQQQDRSTNISKIHTRKWEKQLVRFGSLVVPQYVPDRPERTPGLVTAGKVHTKRGGGKIRGRRQIKYIPNGRLSFGRAIDENGNPARPPNQYPKDDGMSQDHNDTQETMDMNEVLEGQDPSIDGETNDDDEDSRP